MSATTWLPILPLYQVLLPGAALGLRVFERRYLDMLRECGRSGRGFGVCLILSGHEAGAPATPAAWGTEAGIEDFDLGADGLLQLRLRGTRRFKVRRTRIRDNGLVMCDPDWRPPDGDDELKPEHALLGTVLQRMLEKEGGEHGHAASHLFDEAGWVGWRLAELLPISPAQRLALLQMDDVHARLERLLHWIE